MIHKTFVSYYDDVLSVINEGQKIILAKESFYPALEIEAELIERNREELGGLELVILKLVKEKVGYISDISKIVGIPVIKLKKIIENFLGTGLITESLNALNKKEFLLLTELGKMAIDEGAMVVKTTRSFYFCGITGQLMPAKFYSIQPIGVDLLPEKIVGRFLIENSEQLSINSNFKSFIENKRKFNIPDEAIDIQLTKNSSPKFFPGFLIIYIDKNQKNRSSVFTLGIKNSEFLTMNGPRYMNFIINNLLPFGFDTGHNTENIINLIVEKLHSIGCTVNKVKYSGNIEDPVNVYVKRIDNAFYKEYFFPYNKPYFFLFGNDNYTPVAIGKFFVHKSGNNLNKGELGEQEILNGYPLNFIADEDILKNEVDIIREYANIENFFRYNKQRNLKGQRLNIKDLIKHKFEEKNKDINELINIFKKMNYTYGLKFFEDNEI